MYHQVANIIEIRKFEFAANSQFPIALTMRCKIGKKPFKNGTLGKLKKKFIRPFIKSFGRIYNDFSELFL